MHSLSGDLIPVPRSHSWNVVTQELAIRIQNMMPPSAVLVATVTDNGANFVKMAKALHTNLSTAAIDGIGEDSWDAPLEVWYFASIYLI
jgi:hypothetical protein